MTLKGLEALLKSIQLTDSFLEISTDKYYLNHEKGFKYVLLKRDKRYPNIYVDEVYFAKNLKVMYEYVVNEYK